MKEKRKSGWRKGRRRRCSSSTRGTPAWPEKEESLSLSLKKIFWKITRSPVMRRKEKENGQQLEEDEGEHRCEEEDRFSITELCCLSHSFYTPQKGKWPFDEPCGWGWEKILTPAAFVAGILYKLLTFEPCGWGWEKILNPAAFDVLQYLTSFWS